MENSTKKPNKDVTEIPKSTASPILKFKGDLRYLLLLFLVCFNAIAGAQPLSLTITSTDCTCCACSDGTATANVTGGNPPYSYEWSYNGIQEPTIDNLGPGQYEVWVYDEDGTSVYGTVFISQPNGFELIADITNVTCGGGNDGSIFLEATNGVAPYFFSWSNGSSDSYIENLEPGEYDVTVTDINGCYQEGYYSVSGPSPIEIQLDDFSDEVCSGYENGYITISTSGGTFPHTITWSNGMTGLSLDELAPDTYVVTVTDDHDCTETESYTINPGNDVEVNLLQIQDIDCYGDADGSISVLGSDGNTPYSYEWSNGLTTPTISNLFAGDYTVTVNDEDNCFETASYEVFQPTDLIVNLMSLNHETCAGDSDGSITIGITGGVNPYTAEWSNGLTGVYAYNLNPGFHTVTVTDDNGCLEIETYYVDPGSDVQVDLVEFNPISCYGGSNGLLSLDASEGSSPYTYLWSNGMTGSLIDELPALTYTCTVTDDFGCTDVSAYELSEPTAISISILQTSENLCYGDTLADLSVIVSGGTPGYSGQWSDNSTGLENTNLAAGAYTISVTDANSCLSTQTAVITEPSILFNTVFTTNETGFEANDGTASALPGGGTPPYSFLWSNGDTDSTTTALPPGIYSVTITDMNGCTVSGMEQVQAYGCALDVTTGSDYAICENDTSNITPLVTGGSGIITYLWTDGSTGTSLQVTQGGEYCVTVTDEGNCQNVDCIIVTVNSFPPFSCPVTDESVPEANDGAISCDSLPGNILYTWSNEATTASISGLAPGEYCVTTTDEIGCSATQCFFIQPANCQIALSSEVIHVACHGDASGSIALHLAGALEPVTYNWSHGDSSSVADLLTAGNYSVTITDAAECFYQEAFTITEPPALLIAIDSIAPADQSGSGFIGITVSGGTPGYSFQWVDPADTVYNLEDMTGLVLSGYYSLIVTDSAGCTIELDSVFVEQIISVSHQASFKSIHVYPVPANDVLFIDTESSIEELIIADASGRICKKINTPGSNKIDISDLGPGWYALRVFDGREWYVTSIMK